VVSPAGTEIQWQGTEVAAVAAVTEEIGARCGGRHQGGLRSLPHLVKEEDVAQQGRAPKPPARFSKATRPRRSSKPRWFRGPLRHPGDHALAVWSRTAKPFSGRATASGRGLPRKTSPIMPGNSQANLKVPAGQRQGEDGLYRRRVRVERFRRRFVGRGVARGFRRMGVRPVRLFLDRATEQRIAGNRPSAYADIKIVAARTAHPAWSRTPGPREGSCGGSPPLPYISTIPITRFPNKRLVPRRFRPNTARSRVGAPNNQQAAYLTCSAVEDSAAKAGLDPLEVFKLNLQYRPKSARIFLRLSVR